MRNKYKRQIHILLQNPELINEHWSNGLGLFQMAARSPIVIQRGCLTMIRKNEFAYNAQTPELTKKILNDKRIPKTIEELIEIENLEETLLVFAEYQNEIDDLFGEYMEDTSICLSL